MNRMKLIFLLVFLLLTAACNDPDETSTNNAGEIDPTDEQCESGDGFAITGVIGDIEEGLQIVVCGSDFGDIGPSYVLFDNFESGAVGEPVEETSPLVGQWLEGGKEVSDESSRSGDLSMVIGGADNAVEYGILDEDEELGLMHFDEIFVSWALRDMGVFPGNNSTETSFSTDSSAKDLWLMYGNRGDNYNYSCSQGTCNGNDVVLVSHTGGGRFSIGGNTTNVGWWLGDFWQFEVWNPMSIYLKINSDDPYGGPATGAWEHISHGGGYLREDYNDTFLRKLEEVPPVWDRLKFGSWYRRDIDGFRRLVDDIYIAVGEGAPARLEIADAPVIEGVTRLAISTVDDWSNDRLEATLRLGDLDPKNDDLYLYVVDANNQRSPGFSISDLLTTNAESTGWLL